MNISKGSGRSRTASQCHLYWRLARNQSQAASTPTNNTNQQPPAAPQSTNELTRDTVLSLVRGKYAKNVIVSMSTSSFTLRNQTELYTQMIQAKVLTCRNVGGVWMFCRGGASGSGFYLTQQEAGTTTAGSLALNIGAKVPSSVTGISKVDQATAYADVIFAFEPNSSNALYTRWSDVFTRPDTQNEQHRVILRLYDDGWRVERFN